MRNATPQPADAPSPKTPLPLETPAAPNEFSVLPQVAGAHALLKRISTNSQSGQPLDEATLLDLAWSYFLAGIASRGGPNASQAHFASLHILRPADAQPSSPSSSSPSSSPPQTGPRADEPADPTAAAISGLTARRFEVLQLVARGLTNREIGETLGISSYTVKSHLAALFDLLDVSNRTEAAFALQQYEARFIPDID